MLYYQEKQYSKVRFIFGIKQLYYSVDTYINDEQTTTLDIFPSLRIVEFADIVYCVPTEDYLKFRGDHSEKKYYSSFFEHASIRKVSLHQLIQVIESEYDVQVKIWNEQKWTALATLASDQDELQEKY